MIDHAPYEDTFRLVNVAYDLIKAYAGKSAYDQAAIFMLYAVKAIDGLTDRDHQHTVVLALTDAATGFPPLLTVIEKNA